MICASVMAHMMVTAKPGPSETRSAISQRPDGRSRTHLGFGTADAGRPTPVAQPGGTLGAAESHGCIRVNTASIDWLAARIGPGTPATIYG
jgi:hypothetical protein